ncbi:GntR family transcriptional regulator [Leifsonia sp. Leaf264]|uniref:GntR family transcriptional regulator n=1 Tax=Leifsonia sp. Leaf264 TaxID=1736314 RepID=UPI00070225AD|nr:GntR family transcriptional regulator [Leifsonia sp. Leaf264]KQO93770.1 GntR family transcriptional regulator [Leifsonia sp. Leaf264]
MVIRVDPSSPRPLFEQLAAGIRGSIVDGRLVDGERLPSARALAESLDINVNTVLHGYRVLRDEGLVELHRGRGAVVTVRVGGHAVLAGLIHDLVAEAREHRVAPAALHALIDEAYR